MKLVCKDCGTTTKYRTLCRSCSKNDRVFRICGMKAFSFLEWLYSGTPEPRLERKWEKYAKKNRSIC